MGFLKNFPVTHFFLMNKMKHESNSGGDEGMRNRKNNCRCGFAAALLLLGMVFLCFVSWRFMLFLVAAVFIIIGIILIRKC